MSKQQHTPGPWTATQYGYEKFSVNGEKGVEICGAWNKANACLMATAPELLEAAEHCRELLMRYEINRVNGEEIADEAIAKLNAAIARARGEA